MEVVQVCKSRIIIQHEVFSQPSFLWVSRSVFPINVPISDISVALVSSGTSSASATAVIFPSLFQSFYIVWEDICSFPFHRWHTGSSSEDLQRLQLLD